MHVNRTIQRLRTDKLIEIGSGILTIPDVRALREAAGFNGNYLHIKHHALVP